MDCGSTVVYFCNKLQKQLIYLYMFPGYWGSLILWEHCRYQGVKYIYLTNITLESIIFHL